MLFDLRSRGRRRMVRVLYASLAVLMGGGLVLFGIGGATSGGLLDAIKGGGGGSSGNQFAKRAQAAEKRAKTHPRDAAAWAALARARYQEAGIGDNYDQTAGAFTAKGKQQLRSVGSAWDHYLALNPPKPDPNLAAQMVQAFGPAGLNQATKAVTAQEIIVDAQPPSAGLYARLAVFAYAAGQTRKGDLAAGKALALAPKAQRAALKQQLAQAKVSPQQVLGGG